ncbi:MAG TPA: hypothetical protein VD997_05945 [Phycisphaerales bacterium]|nr:hypothetical protein [Phycisphaerales bacterium]
MPITRSVTPDRNGDEQPRVDSPRSGSPTTSAPTPRTEQPRLGTGSTRGERVTRGGMPLTQRHLPPAEPRGGGDTNSGRDRDHDHNGRDGRGGRGGRDWHDRDHGDRDRHWRDRHWRDRDHNHRWGGRDRHHWRHHDHHWGHHHHHYNTWRHRHNDWWIGFSFGPSYSYSSWTPYYGWGTPLYYSSSYSPWHRRWCGPTYYTYSDPLCLSSSYTYSWYYQRPLTYSLIYPAYETTSIYYDTPAYTETTYYYGSTIPSYSSSTLLDYSAKLPADYRAYAGTYTEPTYSAPADQEPVIVYQATRDAGEMVWSDTPTTIVNSLLNSGDRGREAQRFLGRTVAGAWEVTFESARRTADGMELTTRGTMDAGTGVRPTILVNLQRVESGLEPGQRLSITGRLVELSVNDPENAGGLLVLDEADVSW